MGRNPQRTLGALARPYTQSDRERVLNLFRQTMNTQPEEPAERNAVRSILEDIHPISEEIHVDPEKIREVLRDEGLQPVDVGAARVDGRDQALQTADKALESARGLVAKAFLEEEHSACSQIVARAFAQTQHAANNLRKAGECLELPEILQQGFAASRSRRRHYPLEPPVLAEPNELSAPLPPWDAPA